MHELTLAERKPAYEVPDPRVPDGRSSSEPAPWRFATRSLAVRIFLTCWLVYALHWATDVVREMYPALSLGDQFSFRVDEYQGLHPDLFEKPGYGWHINNNPGVSFVAAIPYAVARPLIARVSESVQQRRAAGGPAEPPELDTPRANSRTFYAEAWRRGLDVKLGLAAWVMHAFCMAPISALGVVVMFFLLRRLFNSDRTAVWLALLYAFGTPVFFRTGFLNQNLMLGHFAFMGFLAMWNPSTSLQLSDRARYFLAGLAGGAAVLFDYSGVVILLGLFAYAIAKPYVRGSLGDATRAGAAYITGTLAPILLLLFYQWKSFGNPILPAQHWMPPVDYIDRGYQGFSVPQLDLLWALFFDLHYGLFVCAPIMLLALVSPFLNRGAHQRLPAFEQAFVLLLFAGLWLFFGANNYTHLQANTGIRYLTPILPFLFVPAAVALMRLRPSMIYAIAVLSLSTSWALAMYRQVIGPLGMIDPIIRFFTQGFTLPLFTTLSQTGGQYGEYFGRGLSPLPLFALTTAVLYGLWTLRFQRTARARQNRAGSEQASVV